MNKPPRTRTIVAWTLAILAFGAVAAASERLGNALGVPTSLDVGEHTIRWGLADFESDSESTTYGVGSMILAVLAAIGVWSAIMKEASLPAERATYLGWLLGASILSVGGLILWPLFSEAEGILGFVDFVAKVGLIAAAYFSGKWLIGHLQERHRAGSPPQTNR